MVIELSGMKFGLKSYVWFQTKFVFVSVRMDVIKMEISATTIYQKESQTKMRLGKRTLTTS